MDYATNEKTCTGLKQPRQHNNLVKENLTESEKKELEKLENDLVSYDSKIADVTKSIREIRNRKRVEILRTQLHELFGRPIYVSRSGMYGIVTSFHLDQDGNVDHIMAMCFNPNFETNDYDNYQYCNHDVFLKNVCLYDGEYELVSNDVYLHAVKIFREKMTQHIDHYVSVLNNNMSYVMQINTIKNNGFEPDEVFNENTTSCLSF